SVDPGLLGHPTARVVLGPPGTPGHFHDPEVLDAEEIAPAGKVSRGLLDGVPTSGHLPAPELVDAKSRSGPAARPLLLTGLRALQALECTALRGVEAPDRI